MNVYWRMAPAACLACVLLISAGGCKNPGSPDTTNANSSQQAPTGQNDPNDPANANVAPVSNSTDNTGVPEGAMAKAPQQASQNQAYSNNEDPYANQPSSGTDYDDYSENETPAAYAPEPPPAMPEYEQPPCPGDDYIWTPGYWGYQGGQGYYWVPGAWVTAPYAGALWTPGWWGYVKNRYGWHNGYWGRQIGYYGGINYGHGYDGFGYQGGYWRGDHFDYNRNENNIDTRNVHYVYDYKVRDYNTSHVSFNGGRGGIQARPYTAEVEALHEQHHPPMTSQVQMAQQARSDRQNFASVNRGRPQMVAVDHPLESDHNVPAPQPVRYAPPAPRTGTYPWQAGSRPPQQLGHAVGPEPMVPRVNGQQPPQQLGHAVGPEPMGRRVNGQQPPQGSAPETRAPEARGGPVRAPGYPQAQPRQAQPRQQPERKQEARRPQ